MTCFSNLLTGLHLTDMETCYKVVPTPLIKALKLKCDGFGFEPEITVRLAQRGIRVCEVPISYVARGYGQGKKIGIWDAIKTVFVLIFFSLTR